MDLSKKVVLVTGASRGIGESICLAMLEKGAVVYGTSRTESRLYPFNMLKLDISDLEMCKNTVDYIMEKEGRIDIFINNAGSGIGGSIEDSSLDEAKWQFDVNFFGMYRMLSNILPIMRKQKEGKVILISSVAGFLALPYQGLYSATKYAMEAIGLCLINELKEYNIEVMLVNPGDTNTGFTENRIYAENANEKSDYYTKFRRSMDKMEEAEKKGMDPSVISRGIIKKLQKKRLSIRYIPGYYNAVFFLVRTLPERFVIYLLNKLYL